MYMVELLCDVIRSFSSCIDYLESIMMEVLTPWKSQMLQVIVLFIV